MKRLCALWLAAAAALIAPSPVAASELDRCPVTSTIVSLANRILDGREGLSRLEARKFGTNAAYLLIHYGDLDDAAIAALLDRVTREKLTRATELKRTYQIAVGSYGVEDIRKDWPSMAPLLSVSRSVILMDDGTQFIELARELAEDEAAHDIARLEGWIAYQMTYALADVSDETRATVAATALRMGEVGVALTLLADQSDLTAFYDLAAHYPRNHLVHDDRWFPENYGASIRQQNKPITLGHNTRASRKEFRTRMFESRRVDYRFGSFGFFAAFLNLTGEQHILVDVAAALNDAIDAGRLDPRKRPDQAWISAYRHLVERMGHRAVDEALMIERAQRRHTDGHTVRDTIHHAIAVQALADYTLGDSDSLPDRPALLSPETPVDWQAWARIAGILRRGLAETLIDKEDVVIGIELAFSTGQHDTAIALAGRAKPRARVLRIYSDFMKRLDQECAGYSWVPGPGRDRFDRFLYRFPALR